MLLLANENFPLDAVEALRADSHDVAWIREDSRGASDAGILLRAQKENRIVSSSRKGLNMVYLALTKETKPPCSNLRLKITESCDLNKC